MNKPKVPTYLRSFADIHEAAKYNWHAILPALGIPIESLTRNHKPCPGCGGKDRFRFDDKAGRGSWYCSGGGNPEFGDGFDLPPCQRLEPGRGTESRFLLPGYGWDQ